MAAAQSRRSAVTLLELLLALALTGLLMVLITTAIDLNLRALDLRRTDVERSQLARAVLRHIAADLKNAILYQPIDVTGLPQADPADLLGAGDDLLGDLFGDEELGLGLTTANNLDIAGALEPTSQPGLFGNPHELQVDTSRLPRVDQYHQVLIGAEGAEASIPSDVKTVAYFLQFETRDGGPVLPGTAGEATGGLARREWDRAVTAWAAQQGGLELADSAGRVLAPEVDFLEFRYFDGLQWLGEWDSLQLGGLPIAVEITIGIDPMYGVDRDSAEAARLELETLDRTDFTYRLVVRLPAAQPLEEEEDLWLEDWEL